MKRRVILIVGCLAVIGCKAPTATKPQLSVTVKPEIQPPAPPPVGPPPSWRKALDSRPPSAPFVGGPPPAYVKNCVAGNYKTWDELDACLHNPPKPAPGKLGAAGSTPPAVCPAQQVPAWFIASTGNDNNTCVTSGSPCLTVQAIEQRWGCGGGPVKSPTIAQATTVTFLDNQATTAASNFVMAPIIVDAGSFAITCATTTLATGTMGTVTPKQKIAGSPGQALNVNLGVGGVSNQIVINTTRGSQAWVDGNPLSGTTYLITQPLVNATDAEDDGWVAGNAFSVQQPASIYPQNISATCGVNVAPNLLVSTTCADRVTLNNCFVPNVARAGSQYWTTELNHINVHNTSISSLLDATGTVFHNSVIALNAHRLQNIGGIGGAMTALFPTGSSDSYGSFFGSDIILHGATVFPPGTVSIIDSVAVDNTQQMFVQGEVFGQTSAAVVGSGVPNFIYLTAPGGTYAINARYAGDIYFSPTLPGALSSGISILTDLSPTTDAIAIDYSQSTAGGPVKFFTRPLTVSNFALPIAAGGFNHQALTTELIGGFKDFGGQTYVHVPYQSQPFTIAGAPPMVAQSPALWYRGDFGTVTSGRIQYLSDQFAKGRDLSSVIGAGAFGPIPGPSNNPTMTFNGSDTFIGPQTSLLPGIGANTTMFAVVKTSSAGANQIIFCTDDVIMYNNVVGVNWGTSNGPAVDSGMTVDDGNIHVLAMATTNFNNVAFWTDGVKTVGTNGTNFSSRGTACGLGGFVSIQQFTGDIDEVAMYTALLTDDQIDGVGRYLSMRWGGTWGTPLPRLNEGNGLSGTAVPALTTGTTTLTQAQLGAPLLTFSGTLTGANTVVFPDRGGYYVTDLAAVTFGVNSITFQAGAGSCTAIVAANITGLHQLVTVVTEGGGVIRCSN